MLKPWNPHPNGRHSSPQRTQLAWEPSMDLECSAAPCPVPSWGTKHKGRTRLVPGYSGLGCHPLLQTCFSSTSRKGTTHRKRGHVVAFEELLTPKHLLIFFCPLLSQCRETFPRQAGALSREDFLASCSCLSAGRSSPSAVRAAQGRAGAALCGSHAPRAAPQQLQPAGARDAACLRCTHRARAPWGGRGLCWLLWGGRPGSPFPQGSWWG